MLDSSTVQDFVTVNIEYRVKYQPRVDVDRAESPIR